MRQYGGKTSVRRVLLYNTNFEQGSWFKKCLELNVGEGNKVKFWEEEWVGKESLSSRFLRLYSITLNKDSFVKEMGHWEGSLWI